jgi:positive regulator of sigma E activity
MLIETAQVVSAEGNKAVVRTFRGEACSGCSAAGACKALGGGKEMRVEVLNYPRARAGQRVELALPETSFLKVSAITWLIPLTALVGGAFAGQFAPPSLGLNPDMLSPVLAIGLLVLSWPVVAWLSRRMSREENYIPRIIRILPPADPNDVGRSSTASGACLV